MSSLNENESNESGELLISRYWIFPLLILGIAGSLYLKNLAKRGHTITISFPDAENMEAGKTKVKLRNVPIGTVKHIELSDDLKQTLVTVEIQKKLESILSEDTRFWVVKPRIDSQGVSGFGTLLSGAHIGVLPGKSPKFVEKFIGLEKPPVLTINDDGLHLVLLSTAEKQLKVGNAIYYKGMKVGVVETFEYDINFQKARYGIYISKPFDSLVDTNTSFWSMGAFAVRTSAEGVKVDVNSIESLVSGGIQFGNFENTMKGKEVRNGYVFTLFESRGDVLENREYEGKEFVVQAERSISGLFKGAPVEYRGVKIGRVVTPHISFDELRKIQKKYKIADSGKIPVVIRIEPARFSTLAAKDINKFFETEFRGWVEGGLRARLSFNNLLTGSLKISLDLKKSKPRKIQYYGPYPVIPYYDSGVGEITGNLNNLLTKLNSLPLNELMVETVNFVKGLSPGSTLYGNLESSSQKLEETLDNVKPILNDLDKNPNSFIFGKKNRKDIQPKAKGQ